MREIDAAQAATHHTEWPAAFFRFFHSGSLSQAIDSKQRLNGVKALFTCNRELVRSSLINPNGPGVTRVDFNPCLAARPGRIPCTQGFDIPIALVESALGGTSNTITWLAGQPLGACQAHHRRILYVNKLFSTPKHCPGFTQNPNLESILCECAHCGEINEFFFSEFDRPHTCANCYAPINFSQYTLDGETRAMLPARIGQE